MLGSWKEQTELRLVKVCYQAGKGENLQRKPFFFFLLVKKFCGLFSNWRSISQSFRGATAWQKEGSWIMLLHFPLFVCSVR